MIPVLGTVCHSKYYFFYIKSIRIIKKKKKTTFVGKIIKMLIISQSSEKYKYIKMCSCI